MPCDTGTIVTAAECLDRCVPQDRVRAALIYLSATRAGLSTDPDTLIENSRCIDRCIPDGAKLPVLIYLSSIIAGVPVNAQTLADRSSCIDCGIPRGIYWSIITSTFCTQADVATCDSAILADAAKCIACKILPGMELGVLIYIFAALAGVSNDPETLVANASCIMCGIPPGLYLAVLISLVCDFFLSSPEPPLAPVASDATGINASGFSANWNASAGATSYRLDVSLSPVFAGFVPGYQNLNVGNVATFAVVGLSSGTTYYYRVRAVNADGTSGNSNTISQITVPSAPLVAAPTDQTETSFTSNWAAAVGAASYRLDVSTVNTFVSFVPGYQDKIVAGISDSVIGLTAGTEYFYRVRAVNAGGTSADSATQNAFTLSTLVSGLLDYFKFDAFDGSAPQRTLSSSSANYFEKVNNPTLVPGLINDAVSIDGTTPATLLGNSISSFDISSQDRTFSFWINPTQNNGNIIGIWGESAFESGSQWNLFIQSLDVFFTVMDGSDGTEDVASGTSLTGSAWNHILITWDVAANEVKIYIAGSLAVTASPAPIPNAAPVQSLKIGFTFSDPAPYVGLIDELGAWNRILDGAEIATLFNGGAGLSYPFV